MHDSKQPTSTQLQTRQDVTYMARALKLARRGLATTPPNPAVGCVIVKDGQIIAEGWHERTGEPHAEIMALNNLKGDVVGSTVYVTLEPCCFQGLTPACTEALIKASVARVVVAMLDPNPKVSGQGMLQLEQAGINTTVGICQAEAEALNRAFIKRMSQGVPFVTVKMAMSMDGKTALANGASQWISGEHSRHDVHRMRARHGAILTGIGTVLRDDPELNVRGHEVARQPIKVILDSHLATPVDARLFADRSPVLIFTVADIDNKGNPYHDYPHVEVIALNKDPGRHSISLKQVLQHLAQRSINSVMVEAGRRLTGSFMTEALVDELVLYVAPDIMGSDARGLFDIGLLENMSDKINLEFEDVRQIGRDLRVTLKPTSI